MIRTLVLATTLAVSTGATAAPVLPVFDKSVPTVDIVGVVDRDIINKGKEVLRLSSTGESTIQLLINSPGGQVIPGTLFIGYMEEARARGTKFRCYVPQLAASMAFQILLHCDERYTLNSAYLLWHRARVMVGGGFGEGAVLTGPVAMTLAQDLLSTDNAIYRDLVKFLGKYMDVREMARHFEAETLHVGMNLHAMAPEFITTSAAIPGLLEYTEEVSLKGKSMLSVEQYEVIHIAPNSLIQNTTTGR